MQMIKTTNLPLLHLGVWEFGNHRLRHILLDVCVMNTDTQFHVQHSVVSILSLIERTKTEYARSVEACHATFTPFIVSADGF